MVQEQIKKVLIHLYVGVNTLTTSSTPASSVIRRRTAEVAAGAIGRLLCTITITAIRTACTCIALASQVRISSISTSALVSGASVTPSTSV